MNGKVNKDIKNIYNMVSRLFCSETSIAVLAGPGGTGYIAGHDGKRLCSGDVTAGPPTFTYEFWKSKPIGKWIIGTAEGSWQTIPRPATRSDEAAR